MYAYWTRTRIITFLMTCSTCLCRFISIQESLELKYSSFSSYQVLYSRKVWQIDSFRAFGKRKFGEIIDQPIDY